MSENLSFGEIFAILGTVVVGFSLLVFAIAPLYSI
jgi:hypothetical protein